MAEQSVTLEPGESKVVSFEAIPKEARVYQVSVNGLTGSFKAIARVVIPLGLLSVLDVEGIPFSEKVTEVPDPTSYWRRFGQCLQETWGPHPEFGIEGWITNGVGLAMCMMEKGAVVKMRDSGGAELLQCGLEHPEYLTDYSNNIRPASEFTYTGPEMHYFATAHGIGVTDQQYNIYVGQVIEDTPEYTLTITGHGKTVMWCDAPLPYARVCSDYPGGIFTVKVVSSVSIRVKYTYKVPQWTRFGHQAACDKCLMIFKPEGIYTLPPSAVPVTYYVLTEPIVMSSLRGISLTIQNHYQAIVSQWAAEYYWFHLWYEPTFDAPMPPPAFRATHFNVPEVGAIRTVSITELFGAGYYYPGIYDGRIQLSLFMDDTDRIIGDFRIKNLARVTGSGTVVS